MMKSSLTLSSAGGWGIIKSEFAVAFKGIQGKTVIVKGGSGWVKKVVW
jgi:hypothetical protein